MSTDTKLSFQNIFYSHLIVSGYSYGGHRGSSNLHINMELDFHVGNTVFVHAVIPKRLEESFFPGKPKAPFQNYPLS